MILLYTSFPRELLHMLQADPALASVQFLEVTEAELMAGRAVSPSVDLLLIGEHTDNPIRLAQQVQRTDPHLSILLMSDPLSYPRVQQALQLAPGIGPSLASISSAGKAGLAAMVKTHLARTAQRRNYVRLKASLPNLSLPAYPNAERIKADFAYQAFEEAPIGILLLGKYEEILSLNPFAVGLLGTSERNLLGKTLWKLFPNATQKELRTFLQAHTATQNRQYFALDETNRYVEITLKPLPLEEKGHYRTVLMHEVTEQLEAHRRAVTSAHQLRLLTDAMPVLIGYLDREEKYRFANRAYQAWFHQDPATLLGRPVRKVVGEQAYAGVKDYIRRALAGERLDFEARMPYRDDFTKYIRTSYVPDVQAGEVVGFYTLVTDITESVLAQQQMEESAQRFRLLTESIPQMIWTAMPDGYLNYFSQQWYNYSGYDEEHSTGEGWIKAVHPEDLTNLYQRWTQALRTGAPYQVEARVKRADGMYRWQLIRALPQRNEEGTITQWMGTFTDLQDQRQAKQALQTLAEELATTNEELQAANEDLAASNQQLLHVNSDLDNFIYTASHDLKTPIANIEGLLYVLIRHLKQELPTSSRTQHITTLMQESVERFKKTIDNLNDVIKLQKEYNGEIVTVDLREVIQEVWLDLEPQRQAVGAQIEIDIADPALIRFSKKNARSVVYNLLSNSLKYRSPARVPLIRIHGKPSKQYYSLAVEDNGLGMTEVQVAKLFSMFRRFHDHIEGSGIGLYMIRKMIENVGGTIEVESQPQVGTTFRVYFPDQ
ncbi:PAS domain S-box-containing protein [Catalinimonas alkaloidigena]|uniref:histidine kinase n=1 Tax=Catalinimonas alkaloidigena TaxID=1075417 RepID=A0A1G9TQ67_9BACT|nr:PAS domain-containing sensor histidine kinase [Catalinimonas alkaloidigena]SDM49688.1 PAS domain S-box-containing protein [Catalinimonas alkaloidigena]